MRLQTKLGGHLRQASGGVGSMKEARSGAATSTPSTRNRANHRTCPHDLIDEGVPTRRGRVLRCLQCGATAYVLRGTR